MGGPKPTASPPNKLFSNRWLDPKSIHFSPKDLCNWSLDFIRSTEIHRIGVHFKIWFKVDEIIVTWLLADCGLQVDEKANSPRPKETSHKVNKDYKLWNKLSSLISGCPPQLGKTFHWILMWAWIWICWRRCPYSITLFTFWSPKSNNSGFHW